MESYTPDFSLNVQGVKGYCPAGEVYAKRGISERKIPVLSCEGPCIRGEIARLAANLVSQDLPSYARACHAETFFVPHSAMASWVKEAEKSVMIDGCFLKCHGRALKGLVREGTMLHIDALPLYNKYTDIFLMDDVPEEERRAVARLVADKIISRLKQENPANRPPDEPEITTKAPEGARAGMQRMEAGMHWGADWHSGWFWGMHLGMWIFWILVAVVVWVLVSRLQVPRAPTAESPLEVLQRRYAEGALTTVEYEERRQKLVEA